MDCCGKVTEEKPDSIMTIVAVPDVPTEATKILFVPHSVGYGPENWIRSFGVHWDELETVDQVMDRI